MILQCHECREYFKRKGRSGPIPRFCTDACRVAFSRGGRVTGPRVQPPPAPVVRNQLTLRDVVSVAELDLSVRQCDAILEAFSKARVRATLRERQKQQSG